MKLQLPVLELNTLCYAVDFMIQVVELEISVITFELVHVVHVSQNVAVKDCTLYMNAHL